MSLPASDVDRKRGGFWMPYYCWQFGLRPLAFRKKLYRLRGLTLLGSKEPKVADAAKTKVQSQFRSEG